MTPSSGAFAHLDPAGILYGEYRAGSLAAEARHLVERRIRQRLRELRARDIQSVDDALAFVADFYVVALERDELKGPGRNRKLKKNRALSVFERYRPGGNSAMVASLIRNLDSIEKVVGKLSPSLESMSETVKRLFSQYEIPSGTEAEIAATTYMTAVIRQRKEFGR